MSLRRLLHCFRHPGVNTASLLEKRWRRFDASADQIIASINQVTQPLKPEMSTDGKF
jgi:hypothetical protein